MEKLRELWENKKPLVIGVGVAVLAVITFIIGKKKGWFGSQSGFRK
ncbi:MAG: hypothetical protein ACK5B9_03195 [Flavobacteriia bacterium]|jgi:hypothetical protein